MKLNDIKHNHSLTDLLKIIIFSILMMIPFIDVGTRCLYVICNKNAYQSYSGYNIETNTELATNIESGLNYQLNINTYTGNVQSSSMIGVDNLDITSSASSFNTWYGQYKNDIKYIEFRYNTTNNQDYIYYYDENGNRLEWFTLANAYYNVYFTATNNSILTNNDIIYRVYQQQVGNSLDNVFIYSVNQISQSELYTWTQQTAIYTGVQTMTRQLGINNTVIPILLVYWFILSVIYIIIDIILKLFTILTHAIGSKTA